MEHFLEEHYWICAIAVFVLMVLLIIFEILLWRLRKLKKQYDDVLPSNLPPEALEFLGLIRQVLSASKAEINQVNEELQKLKRGLEANKDKNTGKEKGLSEG